MARGEEELRKEAVRRRLAGESPTEIALSLGRSPRWVAKWVGRHEPGDASWAQGAKRGPKRPPNRTAADREALVLAVRERLEQNPLAQVGAEAIAWELQKLGVEPPPRRSIERIVAREGATRRRGRTRRKPKGVPYPALAAGRVGDVCEADLVGPRHLEGGLRFALNAVDLASHRSGIEIIPASADGRVAGAFVALWERLGVPGRLKLDNGGPFGGARGLGLVARLCLRQGVILHFIPQGEPWRSGTVEHFNDTFDRRFFRQERFASLEHLKERALACEVFRSGNHRYRASGGRTADETSPRVGCSARPLSLAELPAGWPATGRVEFVRFIRSDRKCRLLGRAITMPETVVYEYVTAVLDLAIPPAESNLRVLREGEIVATASITIG